MHTRTHIYTQVTPASVMSLLASAVSVSAADNAPPVGGGTVSDTHHAHTPGSGGTAPGGSSAAAAANTGAGSAQGSTAAAGAAAAGTAAGGGAAAGGSRVRMWPAVRVALDGLGLDSKPVSRCRQCVLKIPGVSHGSVHLQLLSALEINVDTSEFVGFMSC